MTAPSILVQALLGVALGIVGLCIGSLAMPAFCPSSGSGEGGPVLELDRPEWDFGRIPRGGAHEARFHVFNRGSQRLVLRRLAGDCECLVAREAEILIAPGCDGWITAVLDAERASGRLRSGFHFQTNDPMQRRLALFCAADIITGL
jgi:hypothetical protein